MAAAQLIRVWPKDAKVRKVLRHPSAGGFRADGPAQWPPDAFTMRRIRDGDVELDLTQTNPQSS